MFKTKNRILATMLVLTLCMGLFAGCGKVNKNNSKNVSNEDNKTYSIVCTTFPQYDWVMEVLGEKKDKFDVTLLLDDGVDLHSYQPTAEDIAKIAECDMFIHVGGESDDWVEDIMKEATNKDMQVINLVDDLGENIKQEEIVEGMEHNHEHEHEAFTEEDIKDRKLSEFSGEWKSLYPLLLNGDLDQYCEHKAEEDEDDATTKETYYEKYKKTWNCDVNNITVDGDTITFIYTDGTTCSAKYTYAGYCTKTSAEGKISVRYQFKTDDSNAPKYVQFNDHGYEPGEVEHFHIYYGDESFDALLDAETNPYFMKANLSNEEILEGLTGHSHEHESDEHVWLSLKNAEVFCDDIADKLAKIAPENKETYFANADAYIKKLSALDKEYRTVVDAASVKTLLFGDRFPFRYLVDDYGLDYYAAFSGCSAETEASFDTIVFLSKKVDELGLNAVLTIENSDKKIAQTIVDNTKNKNQHILVLDSMQSITNKDIQNGATYLSVMQSNLEVLKEALQ